MEKILPTFIKKLPRAETPIDGLDIYVSQGKNHQIVFMEFHKDVEIPAHTHENQWELVLDGMVDVWINEKKHTYQKGDQFCISSGVIHHARVYKGYRSIAFFNEPQRYTIKK